ncbi:hypothetical protein PPL_04710 [Heterostelium album PN500]|uniref:Homeobox domain-containing protein n=1 Tax=Heterostelium pallidum (strain ATCC 26659 / Pp 5 / PN500) TaxID=670386 RepID=D3B8B8_HETP5|nr:hypothetical protein PPL_04710 [Heterostelium album PN500]EFA82286.1 hypothetical protein PPL_04710 [Heterostelium album PN500]|eukprot:XP_020434403.1 hypothetical protein PPL_04710 [Heterostelium album PN500]
MYTHIPFQYAISTTNLYGGDDNNNNDNNNNNINNYNNYNFFAKYNNNNNNNCDHLYQQESPFLSVSSCSALADAEYACFFGDDCEEIPDFDKELENRDLKKLEFLNHAEDEQSEEQLEPPSMDQLEIDEDYQEMDAEDISVVKSEECDEDVVVKVEVEDETAPEDAYMQDWSEEEEEQEEEQQEEEEEEEGVLVIDIDAEIENELNPSLQSLKEKLKGLRVNEYLERVGINKGYLPEKPPKIEKDEEQEVEVKEEHEEEDEEQKEEKKVKRVAAPAAAALRDEPYFIEKNQLGLPATHWIKNNRLLFDAVERIKREGLDYLSNLVESIQSVTTDYVTGKPKLRRRETMTIAQKLQFARYHNSTPSIEQKRELAKLTGRSLEQVSTYFTNRRRSVPSSKKRSRRTTTTTTTTPTKRSFISRRK